MESKDLTSSIIDDAKSSENTPKTVTFEEPTGKAEEHEVSLFWDIVEGVKNREVRGFKSAGRGAYYAAVLVAAFLIFLFLAVFIPALIITVQTTLSSYTLLKVGLFIFTIGSCGTLFGWFYSLRVNKKHKKIE